jgi:hypothetical protein
MSSMGWEIRPAGWLFVLVLGVVLFYCIVRSLQDASKEDPRVLAQPEVER